MTTWTANATHRGRWFVNNGNYQPTSHELNSANSNQRYLLHWTAVPIPAGAMIQSVELTVQRSGVATSFYVLSWSTDDAPEPASDLPDPSVDTFTRTGPMSLVGAADVSEAVNAVLSRPGWVEGNGLTLILEREISYDVSFSGASLTIEYFTTQYLDQGAPVDAHARVGQVQSVEFAVNPQPVTAQAEVGVPQVIAPKALYTNPIAARARVNVPATFSGSGDAPDLNVAGVLTAQAEVLTPTLSRTLPPEPPPIPWERLIEDPRYHESLRDRTQTTGLRADIISEDEAVIAHIGSGGRDDRVNHPGLIGGSVTMDSLSSIRWTCDLQVDNPDLLPTSPYDLLHPLSHNRVRLWWRVWLADGSWGEIPIGTFYPDQTPHGDDGTTLSVRFLGSDAVAEIKRARWNQALDIGGATISQAIIAIIENRAPWVRYAVTPTTVKVPNSFDAAEPGEDPWEDIEALAHVAGMVAYADRMGVIRVEPRKAPGTPRAVFAEGDDSTLISMPRVEVNLDQLVNHVTIVSSNPEVEPPVVGVAQDDDPSSPLWVGRGHLYSTRIESSIVSTVATATRMAQNVLNDRAVLQHIDIDVIPHPHLEGGDTVSVERSRASVMGEHQIDSWTLSLAPGDLMSLTVSSKKRDWR